MKRRQNISCNSSSQIPGIPAYIYIYKQVGMATSSIWLDMIAGHICCVCEKYTNVQNVTYFKRSKLLVFPIIKYPEPYQATMYTQQTYEVGKLLS